MKDVARFFKVLSDEARLEILWLLFNNRELCVCDIMAALRITQSKASRHLATLRHAGLVTDRKAAAWSYYSIRPAGSDLERAMLRTLRAGLAGHEGADRALRDLRAWLRRKNRGASCSADGTCGPATIPGTASRKRGSKPLPGGHG